MDVCLIKVPQHEMEKGRGGRGGGDHNGNSLSICWLNNKSSIFVPKTPNHYNGEKGFMNFSLSMK